MRCQARLGAFALRCFLRHALSGAIMLGCVRSVRHAFVRHSFVRHAFVRLAFVRHAFVRLAFVRLAFVRHAWVHAFCSFSCQHLSTVAKHKKAQEVLF